MSHSINFYFTVERYDTQFVHCERLDQEVALVQQLHLLRSPPIPDPEPSVNERWMCGSLQRQDAKVFVAHEQSCEAIPSSNA